MASKVIEPDISDVGLVRLTSTKFKIIIKNQLKHKNTLSSLMFEN